jgi:outer membrane receptor protein involved in Fe transport
MGDRVVSPELQSSLMLSWQFGNHTARAITNYFDSFKDISELDLEEINAFVDNITTVDLQYGYSVKTGSNDRAIISFGIRNIFNEKTSQILNSTTRILDQNGRVAYGSIKYQF